MRLPLQPAGQCFGGGSQGAARRDHLFPQIRQQYLAIRCENTYDGTVHTDSAGNLLTTKDDPAEHGFGLMKMRSIAEKYGSVLDVVMTKPLHRDDGTAAESMTILRKPFLQTENMPRC